MPFQSKHTFANSLMRLDPQSPMHTKNTDETLLAYSLLAPVDRSTHVADFLRSITDTEPVILSKPGLKLDRITVYLAADYDIATLDARLKESFIFSFKSQTARITESDWRDKWKEHFAPFKLTPSIKVIPSWVERKKKSRLTEIILDPGYAFGTGLHETTRFMARMLEQKKRRCRTFFDIGYGSGILPIVAAKLGYTTIIGIDNDENAHAAATGNSTKNGVTECLELFHRDLIAFPVTRTFDFIGANLDTTTLMGHSKKIITLLHSKSYLCISGIGVENRRMVHKHYKAYGLRCIKKYIGREWCGYLYKVKKEIRLSRFLKQRGTKRFSTALS